LEANFHKLSVSQENTSRLPYRRKIKSYP